LAQASAYRLVPECRLLVDGKRLATHLEARLTRVEVDLDVDLIGQSVLIFNDPFLELINGTQFASGVGIQIELGFHTALRRVFEGEVVALEPQFRRDLPPSLRVVCQERLHRLALATATRALNAVDDKQIVTRIAQEHGLSAQAPAGTKEHSLQSNVSDAVFLRRLAHKQGHHLRIDGKRLIIGPPVRGPVVRLSSADDLREIRIKVNAKQQVGEVSVHGWDPKTKSEFVAKAKPQGPTQQGAKDYGGGSTLSIAGHEHAPADVATAEAMAKGRLRTIAEGFVTAEVQMVGNPSVAPGAQIELEKMGANVDGSYRVERALHKFSKHGYYVTFKAVRTAKKQPAKSPPAARQQPSNATWLELELLDSQGQPVPFERYKVVTADGKEIEGKLDAEGRARLSGIPPGSNSVSFPDYESEWHRV